MIHGFYGMGNTGDEAILAATVALLRERLAEVEIMVVSGAPRESEQRYPVMAIDRHDLHGQSAALSQADLLLFGGGGLCNDYWQGPPANVFDDGWGGLPYYLRLPLLARLHEIPFAVYAQGVGPLASVEARRMVRFVFDQADDISVRDRHSAELLRELGVSAPVEVSADPAFLLQPDQSDAEAALRRAGIGTGSTSLIGVSVRPFPTFTPGRVKELAHAVGLFAVQANARVVLLPFCSRGNSTDVETCQLFAEALGREVPTTVLGDELSPGGMLGVIARMDLVVATRYHAGLFAMRSAVPFVGISYDPKVESLVEESEIREIRGLSVAGLDSASITPLLVKLWENRDGLRAKLAKLTAIKQKKVADTMDRVCRLAASSHRAMSSLPDRHSKPLWVPQTGNKSVRTLLNDARTDTDGMRRAAEQGKHKIENMIEQAHQKDAEIRALRQQLTESGFELERSRKQTVEALARISELERSNQADLQEHSKRITEALAQVEGLKQRLAESGLELEAARKQTVEALSRITELERRHQMESEESRKRIADTLADRERKWQAAEERAKHNGERLAQLEASNEQLKKKLAFAQERYRSTAERLQEVCDSRGLQFINRLYNSRSVGGTWRFLKRIAPRGAKTCIRRWLFPQEPTSVPSPAPAKAEAVRTAVPETPAPDRPRTHQEVIDDLERFLERVDQSPSRDFVIFVAGVKYVENEGQRVTQIIRALTESGLPVLLVYFRWRAEYTQPVPISRNPSFFQLPIDLFEPHRNLLIDYAFRPTLRRTCVFEFPYPPAFQWINEFNLAGWKTAYDIIDDWEEFHSAGKAIWYEEAAEHYFCANASAVTAIVPLLAEKAQRWVPGLKVSIVPNGVSPDSFDMTLPRRPLKRGKITVGYFGYLTPAWFDWEMVARIAARRPGWEFHIVGYGEPVPVELSRNVQLLGKVNHHELYAYTQNWDVAIVPFKPTTLSRGADPIKVYEYLTLGLPVVSTDIPHLRGYPNVYVAGSAEEFEQLLERAPRRRLPAADIQRFVKRCTWHQRGIDLIETAQAGREELLGLASKEGKAK